MYKVCFFIFLFLVVSAFGSGTYRLDVYGSSTNQTWNEKSPFNQNNEILQIPTWVHTLELRPDLQFDFTESQSVVLRSRHLIQALEISFQNPKETKSESEGQSDLSDLFFSSTWSDGLSSTVGLQNYQWGPAEIYSPSNPFFHFNNSQRSFFYKEKGRVLTRINWNPNPDTANWSVVGLYEPIDNNTSFWTADKEFEPKSALKIEYQFTNPANAIAFIGGQGEDTIGFIGEYFSWSPLEGHSIYADIKHSFRRSNYVPVTNGYGLYDMLQASDEKMYTLAVVGFRWEGRVDFRQEFVFNEQGYSDAEWSRAKKSAVTLSPNVLINAKRFSAPGLEFRTRAYSYTSIRISDLGFSKMTSLAVRWLSSMDHNSSALQISSEYNWNDNIVLSAEAIKYLGNADGEFRIAADQQISLGLRWSF